MAAPISGLWLRGVCYKSLGTVGGLAFEAGHVTWCGYTSALGIGIIAPPFCMQFELVVVVCCCLACWCCWVKVVFLSGAAPRHCNSSVNKSGHGRSGSQASPVVVLRGLLTQGRQLGVPCVLTIFDWLAGIYKNIHT